MSAEPRQPGWYIAVRRSTDADPVVVRVSTDPEGGCTTVWEIGRRDPSTLLDWRLLHKVHSTGSLSEPDYHEQIADAREEGIAVGRQEGEQIGRKAERARLFASSHFPGDDLDFREVGEAPVVIVMSRRAADEVSAGLSDFLCWCRGFVAALPEDHERHPMSWEVAREIRIALQRAIEASE